MKLIQSKRIGFKLVFAPNIAFSFVLELRVPSVKMPIENTTAMSQLQHAHINVAN